MAIFNSFLYVYQRVNFIIYPYLRGWTPCGTHLRTWLVNDWYFQDVELPIPNLYTVSIIINNHNTILTYPYIYLQCMYIYNSDISSTKSVTWDPLQQQPIPASNVPEPIPSEKVSSAGIMIHHDPHFMVEIQKEARNHQLLLLAVAVVRLLILLIQTDTQLPISQLPWLESLGLVSMDGKTLRKISRVK